MGAVLWDLMLSSGADKTGAPGDNADFLAECADPFGEALRPVVLVRLNDGTGGAPSTLVDLTASHTVLDCTPIKRSREFEFGVVQGQAWVVSFDNSAMQFRDLVDCYCCIQGEFPTSGEKAVFAQGKIAKVSYSTDNTFSIEVHDAIMDVLSMELQRDMMFQDTDWAGPLKAWSTSGGAGSWDGDVNVTVNINGLCADERFLVEFTSSTTYKVILESGDETQTGSTASDTNISNKVWQGVVPGILTIPASGWTGTYQAGDVYVFYTTARRNDGSTSVLSPIGLVINIMDTVCGVAVYDVEAGGYYSNWKFDPANWQAVRSDHDATEVRGFWAAGTRVVQMLQDALKVCHCCIYPASTGQVGLWGMTASSSRSSSLNGEPGIDQYVSVLGAAYEEDIETAISGVTFEYKTLDGEDASFVATNSDTSLRQDRTAVVTCGWRVESIPLESAANIYLNRFSSPRRTYYADATLAGAVVEVGDGITLNEPEIGVTFATTDVVEVTVDLLNNTSQIVAYTDPVLLANYAVVDTDTVGGAKVVW